MKKKTAIKKIEKMKCGNCTKSLKEALIAPASENKYYVNCTECGKVSKALIVDDQIVLNLTSEKPLKKEVEEALEVFNNEYGITPTIMTNTSKQAEILKLLTKVKFLLKDQDVNEINNEPVLEKEILKDEEQKHDYVALFSDNVSEFIENVTKEELANYIKKYYHGIKKVYKLEEVDFEAKQEITVTIK